LDVGSWTGFALLKMKEKMPHVRAVGVEPSPAQRNIGYNKGLSETELVEGDAMTLEFADGSFDLVCEFGALHHIPRPDLAVSEMLRVARKAIFVCDSNNFGQGGPFSRFLKQAINTLGLWPAANLIKTRRRGYTVSDGDGVMYSYSVFTDYKQIAKRCESIHILNTASAAPNLYRTASQVALWGMVRPKSWTADEERNRRTAGCEELPKARGRSAARTLSMISGSALRSSLRLRQVWIGSRRDVTAL
jgi:SAM-dependent methyltransferase